MIYTYIFLYKEVHVCGSIWIHNTATVMFHILFNGPLKVKEFLNPVKRKVKCILVQVLRLCTGSTARRGSRGIALLFHDHGTRKR